MISANRFKNNRRFSGVIKERAFEIVFWRVSLDNCFMVSWLSKTRFFTKRAESSACYIINKTLEMEKKKKNKKKKKKLQNNNIFLFIYDNNARKTDTYTRK